MMSIIQVLFHMTTMLKGRVLRDLGVDIAETMEFTSPSYRLEINLLGRMFAQSGELYSAITQMNPYTKEILDLFQDGLKSYEEWYESQDMGAFVRDFQQSANHLGDFCRRAYQESSEVLDFGVKLANRNNADPVIG
jgi:prephenate dehydrogenase